jgi:hypothetical protein
MTVDSVVIDRVLLGLSDNKKRTLMAQDYAIETLFVLFLVRVNI